MDSPTVEGDWMSLIISYFTTDFGIKFGMLICFDIEFYLPTMKMLEDGVHHYVVSSLSVSILEAMYSTHSSDPDTAIGCGCRWVNLPPMQLSIEVQQALSRTAEAVVLTSQNGGNRYTHATTSTSLVHHCAASHPRTTATTAVAAASWSMALRLRASTIQPLLRSTSCSWHRCQ